MGKRRAVPSHDRPPLDPIFGSDSKIAVLKCAIFGLNSHYGHALVMVAITVAVCAASADTPLPPPATVSAMSPNRHKRIASASR
jgi:hypothetical protein